MPHQGFRCKYFGVVVFSLSVPQRDQRFIFLSPLFLWSCNVPMLELQLVTAQCSHLIPLYRLISAFTPRSASLLFRSLWVVRVGLQGSPVKVVSWLLMPRWQALAWQSYCVALQQSSWRSIASCFVSDVMSIGVGAEDLLLHMYPRQVTAVFISSMQRSASSILSWTHILPAKNIFITRKLMHKYSQCTVKISILRRIS